MAERQYYLEDLAYIHDVAYGDIARDAATMLRADLTRAGFRSGTIVDIGCGSGILGELMSKAGYHVVGVDVSAAMIAIAHARVPDAELQVGSFVSVDLPRSVAVTAIGEVLSYQMDDANDARARSEFFGRAYEALVPGGYLLFDVATPARAKPGRPHRTFAEGPDWVVLVESGIAPDSGLLIRTITSFREVGGSYRRSDEVHALALISPDEVLASLRAARFEAQPLPAYGATALPGGVVAFTARKTS